MHIAQKFNVMVKQMHMFRISDILDKYEQVATAGFAGAWKE